jgi:hypothetical protein
MPRHYEEIEAACAWRDAQRRAEAEAADAAAFAGNVLPFPVIPAKAGTHTPAQVIPLRTPPVIPRLARGQAPAKAGPLVIPAKAGTDRGAGAHNRPLSFPRRREPRTPDGRVDQRRLTRLALQGLAILAGGAALGIAIGAGLVWALLALARLVGDAAALTGWAG